MIQTEGLRWEVLQWVLHYDVKLVQATETIKYFQIKVQDTQQEDPFSNVKTWKELVRRIKILK